MVFIGTCYQCNLTGFNTYLFMYSINTIRRTVKVLKAAYNAAICSLEQKHVFISSGNAKIGSTVNVSGAPVLQCTNCKNCIRQCYAIRSVYRYGYNENTNTVAQNWATNTAILVNDPDRYFAELQKYFDEYKPAFCRLHVSGDFISIDHLNRFIEFMKKNSYCTFQSFTKGYNIINLWIDKNGLKNWPKNFKLMFSGWPNFDITPYNPYNFPVFSPIDKSGNHGIPQGWKIKKCPGKCEVCEVAKIGCYGAKFGTGVTVDIH